MAPHLIHLESPSTSVIVDVSTGVPTILHWGAALGHIARASSADHDAITAMFVYPVSRGALDVVAPLSLMPEHGSGFPGRPGLSGRRHDGSAWAPRFSGDATIPTIHQPDPHSLVSTATDLVAGVELRVEMTLDPVTEVLRLRAVLTNVAETPYDVDNLTLSLALPGQAREALTFGGRWTREFAQHRQRFDHDALLIENYRGRTSHDRVPVAFAGTRGFNASTGEVWAVHLGWSANSRIVLDPGRDGRRSIQIGELLLPGEIQLAGGDSYTTPWVYAAYSGLGTNEISGAFHRHVRAQPNHPNTVRPVTLNTWEAVYFDHDLTTLSALADRAAEIGVERFVLDDGWFHLRRNDHAGLGDWWVDTDVWPNGLDPIINHVLGLGMEFGLWFEPEMVNPDSDLYRAHPDWVLTDPGYQPVLGRHQLVLDLSRPQVSEYLYQAIHKVLSAHCISFIKWDMNRDIVHGSHDHRAGVHGQTEALYALLARIRQSHPLVEIESCSSGGGRTDFAVLDTTCRFWTSDCNDALERQHIQQGFSLLFPPELMGAHIGPPHSHTTGRHQSLAFRTATAFFGHLGVEWNLLHTTEDQRAYLRDAIAFHKDMRPLLHSGTVRHFDHPDDAIICHGVIAADKSSALVSIAQVASTTSLVNDRVRIDGLDGTTLYRVNMAPMLIMAHVELGPAAVQPAWLRNGLMATGQQLAVVGLQPPIMNPESAIIISIQAAA